MASSWNVSTSGSVETKVKTVCASLTLRREKNPTEAGNLAAWNSDHSRSEMASRSGGVAKGISAWDRRTEAETGKTRRAAMEVKDW